MLVLSFNDENDSYKCIFYNPTKSEKEHGFTTTSFDEFELEPFSK